MNLNMNKDEQDRMSYLSSATTLDAPPPYEDISRPPSSCLTDFTDATITGQPEPIPSRPFPVSFNLYYTWEMKPKAFIGEHFDQPCNALALDSGWHGTSLHLYKDIDADSSILATASSEKPWSRSFTITLPGHTNADGTSISEPFKPYGGFKHPTSTPFTAEVSNADSKPHMEKFEWRLSHGKEVKDLDMWSWGLKLVRLGDVSSSQERQPEASSSSRRGTRDHGLTSDGKEVVAVWAANSQFSKNKMGKFQFLGSGARGELGEVWAIMAVMTMLTVWQGAHGKSRVNAEST